MKINHHPQAESLMSCSAGSMPEAFAAVMSSHMTMCPECQKELAFMEAIGVAMFDRLASAPLDSEAPVVALRAGEADVDDAAPASARGYVPAPLQPVIGNDLDAIKWKRVSPGVWQHVIELSKSARGDLRLIKVAPGQALPEHGHTGSELTLVLKGSYRDSTGHYRQGDVADLSGDVTHSPIADAKDGCICLIATDGKLKFKSLVARFIQPFAGI
ncbi:MAG: ChrR family anti-sigma-E factor [Hyphomicrobium sp.]